MWTVEYIAYLNGRYYAKHISCHTVSDTTRQIAEYLNSEKPEKIAVHGSRKSSASILVEEGGDLLNLKWHGCWLTSNVAKGWRFIEEYMNGKIEISL